MASLNKSNVTTNLVGREISIASSFVRQYYTLLNKAPCFIYNFYSHDSTFIHGTIEMANEQNTEPVIGREKIKKKIEDLKLVDCRAKIKQIDCLETLAGGFVIQVIGELSNNGNPMRKFLQTFVLAPGPEETRYDCDSQQDRLTDRRVNSNEGSRSQNQKFYVLNDIFRYQDEGHECELEDNTVNENSNVSVDNTNGGEETKVESISMQAGTVFSDNSNGSGTDYSQNKKRPIDIENVIKKNVERLTKELEDNVKLNNVALDNNNKRDLVNSKSVLNGTNAVDKKNETSEKSTENGKNTADIPNNNSGGSISTVTNSVAAMATVSRPQPSNEPKTWANMVRNYQPTPSTLTIQTAVNKSVAVDTQNQPSGQSSSAAPPPMTPNQLQQPQQQIQQQQQQSANQQSQQLPQQQQHQAQNPQGNNRRRQMMRKPTNKTTGRTIKSKPRPPAMGKPVE